MTTVRGWTPRRRWLGRTAIFNKNRNVVVILRQNSALVWDFIGVEIYGGRKVRAVLINNYHSLKRGFDESWSLNPVITTYRECLQTF